MLLNGLPSGYTGTRKFFKAALISKFGFGVTYYKHFTKIRMNKIMNKNISFIMFSKIMNNAYRLSCFM